LEPKQLEAQAGQIHLIWKLKSFYSEDFQVGRSCLYYQHMPVTGVESGGATETGVSSETGFPTVAGVTTESGVVTGTVVATEAGVAIET
jgi:hypothetical protein